MARIIKFRHWDADNKQFISQYHAGTSLNTNEELSWIIFKHKSNDKSNTGMVSYPLVSTQFTGLLDINGKEIYEGDIVKISGGKLGEQFCTIEYHAPFFRLTIIPASQPSLPMDLDWLFAPKIEIIGNIYENPELIEKK